MGRQISKIRGRKKLPNIMDMRHLVNGQLIKVGRPMTKIQMRGRPRKVGRPKIKQARTTKRGRPKEYYTLNKV